METDFNQSSVGNCVITWKAIFNARQRLKDGEGTRNDRMVSIVMNNDEKSLSKSIGSSDGQVRVVDKKRRGGGRRGSKRFQTIDESTDKARSRVKQDGGESIRS